MTFPPLKEHQSIELGQKWQNHLQENHFESNSPQEPKEKTTERRTFNIERPIQKER